MPKYTIIRTTILISSLLAISACSVTPKKMSMENHLERIESDTRSLFADQEKITAPITLYDAMARALKYNLDHRLKVMQNVLSHKELTAANLSLLPQLTFDAGYTDRDNDLGSSSRSLTTGEQSLESSTSSDREINSRSFGLTWNVLDFGLSYITAKQRADSALITEERRRKVVHNLIQDVRSAYWNAVSAERVLKKIEPMMVNVTQALDNAREAQTSGKESPLSALRYQRELLDSLRQMKILRKELNAAKIKLGTLMNIKPGTLFELDTSNLAMELPQLKLDNVAALEKIALLQRPELREEGYASRINHEDVRKEYLRILPGIELSTAWNYDSNSFAHEESWSSWGASISKNLFEIINAPQNIDRAKSKRDVGDYRRYALSIAVMSQVHISLANYTQALDEYETVSELYNVEKGINDSILANMKAGSASHRDSIKTELQALLSEVRRDLAFSQMRNSVGRIYMSIGADPLPETIQGNDLATISDALQAVNAQWFNAGINVDASLKATAKTH